MNSSETLTVSCAHPVLQAGTEDEVIVGHLLTTRHTDIFGLPVDAHHLPSHHVDVGMQRKPGQVSAAVCMTVRSEENYCCNGFIIADHEHFFASYSRL